MRQGGRWLGATFAALAVVASVVATGTAPAAAQAGEPPGFVPGEATALASTLTLGLSPGGGKPIEVVLGTSKARYQNRTANSEGAAMQLGLLTIFFGPSSQCGDRPPIIPADQLPPTTSNDSRRNQPMATALEVRSPGSAQTGLGGVIGTQIANATADPQSSTASTTTVSQDYGLLALDGGRTEVHTSLVNGVREATAVTTGTRLRVLGDMVVINEPRWEATARSGGSDLADARFTFASASIFGIERSPQQFPADFADFANGVQNLLSGLGVRLTYPKVTVDNGTVSVSPLTLGLVNPPIGIDFIQPLLKALQPLKEENTRNMIAEDCNNQAVLQIADLVLGILSGTGSVTLGVGGVSAFTAATEFPEPPALELPLEVPPAQPPLVLGNSLSTPSFTPSLDVTPSLDLGPTVAALPDTPALPPVAETATPTTRPSTEFELPSASLVSRRFRPGEAGGSAVLVGLGGVLGLAALAAADRFVMRRGRKERVTT